MRIKTGMAGTNARILDVLPLCRYTTERSPLPMIAAEGLTHIVRYVNPAFCCLVGKKSKELVGRPFAEAVPEGAENGCLTLLDRVYRTGEAENLADQAHTHATLDPVYWSYAVWAILDAEERPAGVMIQVTDTSAAVHARQQTVAINEALTLYDLGHHELEDALRQREETVAINETLLLSIVRQNEETHALNVRLQRAMQETNHRVKNNLQVISALADAQIEGNSPTVPVAALERIISHTRTLALLHDVLTQHGSVTAEHNMLSTDVSLNHLLPFLQDSIGRRRIQSEIAQMTVPLSKSAALSILVSELVSNAVKHGEGDITVTLQREGDEARLIVRDEGRGFPPDFDPRTSAHIGLELITSLARHDLQGGIQFTNPSEGGACISVTFPVPTESEILRELSSAESAL
jgi:PAS domain S-box-containing protein